MSNFKNYVELLESAKGESQTDKAGSEKDVTVVDGAAADKSGNMVDGKQIEIDKNPPKKSNPRERVQYHIDEPTDDEVIRDINGDVDSFAIRKSHQDVNSRFIATDIFGQLKKLKSGDSGNHKAFFILGHAGWGKTSIIKKIAKEFGLSIITVYLDKALPEDLGGIPALKNEEGGASSVAYAMPPWAAYMYNAMIEDEGKKFLLFFDEMNQATGEVQNTLMPIILERTICGIEFNNFVIGAAGNYKGENDYTTQLSDPLTSRFGGAYLWNEDWALAIKYLSDKYNDAFDTTYKAKSKDLATKQESGPYTPFEQIARFYDCFTNPRDTEIHIIGYLLDEQDTAFRGDVSSVEFLKEELVRVLKNTEPNMNFDGSSTSSKYVFKSDKLTDASNIQFALDEICQYFHKYFEYCAKDNSQSPEQGGNQEDSDNLAKAGSTGSSIEGLSSDVLDIIEVNLKDGRWKFDTLIDDINSFEDEDTGLTGKELIEMNGAELSGELVTQLYKYAQKRGWYKNKMGIPESMKKD